MIRLKSVRVPIDSKESLESIILRKLRINKINSYKIHKKSLDARNKKVFSYVYDFDIDLDKELELFKKTNLDNISIIGDESYVFPVKGSTKLDNPPIIIGAGPAGLFCAFFLAKLGYKPIIIERGSSIEKRIKDVQKFFDTGILDENSNIEFGEGGAGTFSDGKLNTQVNDKNYRIKKILEIFVECGAPEEILYESKPHIGTDNLRKVIVNLRNKIISMGATFYFDSFMEDIIIENNKVTGIVVNGSIFKTDVLVLAIGHSARETFYKLQEKNVRMEAKPLAIGVRIMHPQTLIDDSLYPVNYDFLPPANYKLTFKSSSNRGVYSFCMCPGGYVVNASSKEGYLVINGMSNYKRDSKTANSAIVVTVSPSDFGYTINESVKYLESIEACAYNMTNGLIPIQYYRDYINNNVSNIDGNLDVLGKYKPVNINDILPSYVNDALKEGINYFDRIIPGFAGEDAIILAPETRTSSPVRIIRGETFESNIRGIYPCGEGSGYAGGITTCAMDGIKVMESIVSKYYMD